MTKKLFRELCPSSQNLGNATRIACCIEVPWTTVGQSMNCSNIIRIIGNPKGQYEEALTVEQVRAFYSDPVSVMQRRIQGEFQLPKPKD